MRNAHIPQQQFARVAGGSERGGHSLDGQLHYVFCAGGLCVRERRRDGCSLRFLRCPQRALRCSLHTVLRRDPEVLAAPSRTWSRRQREGCAKALSQARQGQMNQ